jgi:hypothetical protein
MFWEVICVIDYKQKQGLVNSNEEINSLSLYYPALIKHIYGGFLSDLTLMHVIVWECLIIKITTFVLKLKWPLKSKSYVCALYVCSQCSWDKNENQIKYFNSNSGNVN